MVIPEDVFNAQLPMPMGIPWLSTCLHICKGQLHGDSRVSPEFLN